MSNLLQKASIITTPTAYDTGKILSVKPVQYYGPELVTNGDFATDSDWTKGTGVVISGGKANWINTINNVGVTQSGIITSGSNYKVVFTVSNYVSGSVRLRFPSITERLRSNGTYTYYINATDTNLYIQGETNTDPNVNLSIDNVSVKEVLNADFDFTRNSSATRVGSNGLIQDVASNLPRIDYTGGVGSWKFEPQRTNSVSYSEDFSQLSSQSNVTISLNQIISPEGSLNASSLIDNSVNGVHRAFSIYGTSIASGQLVSHSVFAKAKEHNWFQLSTGGSTNDQWANFDLENGVIGNSSSSANPIIENYGNGWYRCILFATTSANNASLAGLLTLTNNLDATLRSPSYSGSNKGVYVFGLQIEQGSYPTSYIRSNSGSATTRLADAANNAGSSDLISSTEGVLYAEISDFNNDSFRQLTISSGSNSNAISIMNTTTENQVVCFVNNGGVTQASISTFLNSTHEFNKIAIKYKLNDFSVYINGFEIGVDTNGTLPTGLNTLNFDNGAGTGNVYGNTKCVAVFKEALTDLELECLSSWMSFSDLGINFGYTVE
jgi:hypothetical protein